MKRPRWIPQSALRAIHDELLAEHGGASGILNPGQLESTLARPRNLLAHRQADLFALAAAYGYGFARNHCFVDGNKRTALAAIDVFLILNGRELTAAEEEAVAILVAVAEGSVSEDALAEWIRRNSRRLKS